jgi:uroporphyrinogen-III synthase
MHKKTVSILSTRPVSEEWVQKALEQQIVLHQQSFVETVAIDDWETVEEIQRIGEQEAVVVFTSMNAVDAVIQQLNGFVPEWRIYCIGHKTREDVAAYFGETAISGTAPGAAELAEEIIEQEEEEIIFFCGNLRRDELPGKLRKAGIEVLEITVYETEFHPHSVKDVYDAVLFYSPSAVESFFRANKLPPSTIVFAIGETTEATVKKYCTNTIEVAETPSKTGLLQQAMDYFTT